MKIAYLIGLGSAYNGLGGTWRAWTVARHLDIEGSGRVAREALRAALEGYGVSPRSVRRWIRKGKQEGIFREAKNGDLYYDGLHKAAVKFGAWGVGRRVQIPEPKRLFKPDWKQHLWAIYHTVRKDRPISRFTLEWLTGVDRRTQYNLERGNPDMQARACYADIANLASMDADQRRQHAANLREVTGEGWQVKRKRLVKQLPNVYAGTAEVELCPRGREKQARAYFRANSSNHGARVQALEKPEKLFFETKGRATKAVLEALRRQPEGTGEPVKKYYFEGAGEVNWYGEIMDFA